ncbi:hypothetical protein GCM10008019_08930 [Deinococcus soli (ex Cha et al. 2016)]|nr:hypothetical protein GCM10008019_08930 [Deinococcus soli (ex Cha et al. 2016)]
MAAAARATFASNASGAGRDVAWSTGPLEGTAWAAEVEVAAGEMARWNVAGSPGVKPMAPSRCVPVGAPRRACRAWAALRGAACGSSRCSCRSGARHAGARVAARGCGAPVWVAGGGGGLGHGASRGAGSSVRARRKPCVCTQRT